MALENQGGTPNPDGQSGAGAGQAQGTQQTSATGPTPSGAAAQSGQSQGQTQQARRFEYNEDRTDWLPRHRLNEESGKRQAAEQKAAQLEVALETERRRIQALTGAVPSDPKQAEKDEVKTAITGILTELGLDIDTLKSLNKGQLQTVLQAAEQARATAESTWQQHTEAAYTSLEEETARGIGVEALTPKQVAQIRRAYAAEAEQCLAERKYAQENGLSYDPRNDFMARHLRRDPSLIKEFVKGYLDEWYQPARRSVTAQQVRQGRRVVPNGGRSQDLTVSNQPIGNLDNKDDFKKALLAARNAGG